MLLSYYFTFQLHLPCGGGKIKVSFITFWFFNLSHASKILILVLIVLKHFIICTFLIHCNSVQKMLTALFIWLNLEYSENYMDKYQGKMFLNIENILVSQCTASLLFSRGFWSKYVLFSLTYNLRNVAKQNWH